MELTDDDCVFREVLVEALWCGAFEIEVEGIDGEDGDDEEEQQLHHWPGSHHHVELIAACRRRTAALQ